MGGRPAGRGGTAPPARAATRGSLLSGLLGTEQPTRASPERPRYTLAGTAPLWRDLEGYYTRFGDVRELLRGWTIDTSS